MFCVIDLGLTWNSPTLLSIGTDHKTLFSCGKSLWEENCWLYFIIGASIADKAPDEPLHVKVTRPFISHNFWPFHVSFFPPCPLQCVFSGLALLILFFFKLLLKEHFVLTRSFLHLIVISELSNQCSNQYAAIKQITLTIWYSVCYWLIIHFCIHFISLITILKLGSIFRILIDSGSFNTSTPDDKTP